MDALLAALLVPGSLATGAVAVAVQRSRRDVRRREALQRLARARGWSFAARDDAWLQRLPGHPVATPVGRKGEQRVENVCHGTRDGREFVALDLWCRTVERTHEGERTSWARWSVCAVALPAAVPTLELTRENALVRLATALGREDIAVESESFNRRYRVTADDRRFAYDVLHPRHLQQLLDGPARQLRLEDRTATSWERGRLRADELEDRLDALCRFVGAVPSYVWADRGGAAP